MSKKFIKIGVPIITLCLIMLVEVNLASASFLNNNVQGNIGNSAEIVGGKAGYETGTADALILVQIVINIFLSIIGVLLLVYLLYAGYNWLTAQGEEEKVTKAKETIQRAIIGVIIIIAAYAISFFVMSRIEAGTLKGADGGGVGGYPSKP